MKTPKNVRAIGIFKPASLIALLLLRPGRGAEYCDQPVCLSVRVSVCLRAYLWNRWTNPHEILCADLPWP